MSDLPSDLPESVRSMIARKIEQVDERDRALLLAASVQGLEFDSAVVSEAIEMDPADVEERLDVLERVHVFVKRGSEHEFPDLTLTLHYQFVHVLYQNLLYASLQPTRRPRLSGRVARALVAHGEHDAAAARRSWPSCSRRRATLPPARTTTSRQRSTRSACSPFARRCRSPNVA